MDFFIIAITMTTTAAKMNRLHCVKCLAWVASKQEMPT